MASTCIAVPTAHVEDWCGSARLWTPFKGAKTSTSRKRVCCKYLWHALQKFVARYIGRQPRLQTAAGLRESAQIWIGPPPTLSNQPPPQELDQMLHIARKFDVAGRDERNRALGRAGEERVLAHERAALRTAGRDDLARKVRWVSEEDGDGAGYDIASFAPDGLPRLIEVKTTNGWERTPFHITRNELAVAEERRSEWRLFRLWNFSREPKAFELHPPLDAHVSLTATTFQASFH